MYLEINQIIDLRVIGMNQSWNGIVTEIRDKEFTIHFPADHFVNDSLQIGSKVEASFVAGENRYKFLSEINDRRITLLTLKKPVKEDIISTQLRKNFRAPINIPLFLNDKKAITINISLGGISCLCRIDMKFKKGDVVSGIISLPNFTREEINPISFKGEIIRVNFAKELERNNIALKFIEMAQQDKMMIKQYCIEKQQLRTKNSEDYISTTGFRTF